MTSSTSLPESVQAPAPAPAAPAAPAALFKSLSMYLRLVATRKHLFTENAETVLHKAHEYVLGMLHLLHLLQTDMRQQLVMLIVTHDKLLTLMPHVQLGNLAPYTT
jgi:hypothetical protein